ncbi:MAG: ATP-binding protein [Kofleriaceae bacterium]
MDDLAIFGQGPVVIFKWRNADGWPVEYASPNVATVFGYTADEFTSGAVSYGTVLHPDDAERVAREVAAGTASGAASWAHERYRIRDKAGGVRWLDDYTRIIRDAAGHATHYIGYVIDVTDRIAAEAAARELERQLLHAQKLESLGLMAGGVAHDFNNLLTGILGQASLARRQLASVPGLFRDTITQIEGLARRAASLTRQLLAYSGQGSLVIEPTDIGETVRELQSMMAVAASRRTTLVLDLAEPLPSIMADRGQLQQVVMNLLTNAAEALPDGVGTVTVRTGTEACTAERLANVYGAGELPAQTYVTLEVIDTGVGMSAEVTARMFDPFFTTKGTGRGLGMSAVLGIVRSHRGVITVTSTPGDGTRFKLLFPAASAATAPALSPALAAPRPQRGAVLVVDDEATIRDTLAATLEFLGYHPVVARDGNEALTVYARHQAELAAIVIDMTMPMLSGPATVRALRDLGVAIPIVMTSGYSERDALGEAGELPVTAFLQKPFGVDELERVLLDATGR